MTKTILRAEGLSRHYTGGGTPVYALRETSFTIEENEFIVVLGPSGSGKSTLLNLLGGMDSPTSGLLLHRGTDITGLKAKELAEYRKNVVGFVFQFFNLIPSLTALENVELAASIVKNPANAAEALNMVGLSGREGHFPSQLSGGEQQRVSIARAIVKNPSLLLCDEPTGALDSQNGALIVQLLLDVRDRLHCPVITITHNTEIAKIADRVFHMKDGRLEQITVNTHPLQAGELMW